MTRIRVFGGLWIEREGDPLSGADLQPRRLALLSLLAVAGERGYSREKLIGLLWPERDHRHAHHALAQLIHILRRDLDSDLFSIGCATIRVNHNQVTSDYADFVAARAEGKLEEALELYEGPFLDGFYLGAGAEFERWVELERQHLARRAASILETLASRAAERGDHQSAANLWSRLAEQQPLDSRAAAGLIGELAASGNVASALQEAKLYEGRVRKELGILPDTSVVTLVARLRSQAQRLLSGILTAEGIDSALLNLATSPSPL